MLPVWVYILIFICTSLLSGWSYSGVSGISKSFRYLLITLRSSIFFLLLILLINPFLKTETTSLSSPNVLVMLDNSASTQIEKEYYNGLTSYLKVLNELNFSDSTKVNYRFFAFGNESKPFLLDSLTFSEDQTNISLVINEIKINEDEASAVVLISDGIYTKGPNPVFEVSDINIPVFSIGLGDTTSQNDVLVSSVSTNAKGYVNSIQQVTATITSKGFKGESFPVELHSGNQKLFVKTITPDLSNSSAEVNFDLRLDKEGLQQFEIRVPPLESEWTDANNTLRFSIDVQDARQKILSLAFEVHPDVRFIRSLVLADKNTELISRTWLRESQFMEGDLTISPDSVDLVIVHGYPQPGLSQNTAAKVKQFTDNTPSVVIASPQFNPQRYQQQISGLPVALMEKWQNRPITLSEVSHNATHPIMEFPAVTYDRLPLLAAPVDNIESVSGTSVLFGSSFKGKLTNKPVLVVSEVGNRRMALVTAFNWFRMNQNPNQEVRAFARRFWHNLIGWTAADPDNKLLDIQPRQNAFSGSDNIILDGYLKNDRGENESNATINISIASDSVEKRMYYMENIGNGEYRLDLGTLPEGLYIFEATSTKEDRILDSAKGEFFVRTSNAEFMDIIRNEALLKKIAQSTDGEYAPFDSVSGFWERLKEQDLLAAKEQTETSFFYPYQHPAWFIAVILLLCIEWVIRKYLSLP